MFSFLLFFLLVCDSLGFTTHPLEYLAFPIHFNLPLPHTLMFDKVVLCLLCIPLFGVSLIDLSFGSSSGGSPLKPTNPCTIYSDFIQYSLYKVLSEVKFHRALPYSQKKSKTLATSLSQISRSGCLQQSAFSD
jgi:hypothetical protein